MTRGFRSDSAALDRRRFLAGTAAAAVVLASRGRPAWANAQVIHKAGDIEVTTISDGAFALPVNFLLAPDVPADEREAVLRAAEQSSERLTMPNNVPLIRTRSDLILVDTGYGPRSGQASAGQLVENLRRVGIEPNAVTKVVVTHCHPDHLWGSLDGDGNPAFAKASYLLSATELDFWTDPDVRINLIGLFAGPLGDRIAGAAQRHLSRIKDRIATVKDGDEIASGVRVVDSAGHTPGHISIQVGGGDGLLITGDAITNFVISFRHPSWKVPADLDPDRAITTRLRLLDRVAKDKSRIVGAHLPFPGTGFVEREGTVYRFVPAIV
jgi:glyoxylase-like metal-dependent hydrolase (beta-lactamase superfamily II)